MHATQKVHEHLFGNPIINECNKLLRSCRTKEERMRVATLIRSKVNLDPISDKLLGRGVVGTLI